MKTTFLRLALVLVMNCGYGLGADDVRQIYITVRVAESDESAFVKLYSPLSFFPEKKAGIASSAITKSRESFLDELSRPPQKARKHFKKRTISQGITGIFSPAEYQTLVQNMSERKDFDLLSMPSLMTQSGTPALSKFSFLRCGIVPTMGKDGKTIELELFIPRLGEAMFQNTEPRVPSALVTVRDGYTVAWGERTRNSKRHLIYFISSVIVDGAGLPVNEQEANSSGGAELRH